MPLVACGGTSDGGSIELTGNVFDKSGWGAGPAQVPSGSVINGNTYPDGTPATISKN